MIQLKCKLEEANARESATVKELQSLVENTN